MQKEKKVITFQEIIDRLNAFWASKGCVIGQPYGLEVGAGTSNPNTFLRSLGPEPFNVAYVEPSRRPDDGRYGQNPYRLQHYFQYQVILKPAPKNNQELYFESLKALGIDITKHDIRFVEDNWESPAIGAWGLGWEVWLDGMEVTQYTYFQQVAGIPLDVPVLEITLGLERLAMYIQGVDDYREIMFNEQIKYGHLFEQHEYWQSKHNYETADIKDLEQIYSLMRDQVYKQLDYGNYWVAYDYLLKISHIFNILDSRGVISVTDRISRFDVMGKLANRIGKLYVEERESLNYPMMNIQHPIEYNLSTEKRQKQSCVTDGNKTVLELYFEELPAGFLESWIVNYYGGEDIQEWLKSYGIQFQKAEILWCNRRIVLIIDECDDFSELKKEVTGPMYEIAFDGENLNNVGLGFLKKQGASEKDIVKIEKGGKVLLGISMIEKISLEDILTDLIGKIVDLAPQGKKMKWQDEQKVGFIRPLRNIVCFKNDRKLDVSFWGVDSTEYTFCPRSDNHNIIGIHSAQDYLETTKSKGIILDMTYREALIQDVIDQDKDRYEYSENTERLVKTNSFLTEFPNIKFFTLDEKYSELPIELVKKVLEDNQKYIIRVLKEDPKHVEYGIVANKKGDASLIFRGNRKVVQGRLDDALFYWERDVNIKLKDLRKDLKNIVFHPKAGSYKEKVERINQIIQNVIEKYGVVVKKDVLDEALALVKNDKATSMAKEFATLEGIIGRYYAKREGYSDEVSSLLSDHYLPVSEDSDLPRTTEGVLLSFADKVDNVLTFSKVGGLPQGSNDPYEIRKNVYSLIRLLRNCDVGINLYDVVDSKEIIDFFNQRIYQIMKGEFDLERLIKGIAYSEGGDVFKKFKYFDDIVSIVKDKGTEDKIYDTLKRVYNILEKEGVTNVSVNEGLLETDSEKNLFKFILGLEKRGVFVKDLLELSNLLEEFFKETMVNVEQKDIKNNRIAILNSLKDLLKLVLVI